MTFRKSTHRLFSSTCVTIAMLALAVIVWDHKQFDNVGNMFVSICIAWQVTEALVRWRMMRTTENY